MNRGGKGGKLQMCLAGIEGRTRELVESYPAVLGSQGIGNLVCSYCRTALQVVAAIVACCGIGCQLHCQGICASGFQHNCLTGLYDVTIYLCQVHITVLFCQCSDIDFHIVRCYLCVGSRMVIGNPVFRSLAGVLVGSHASYG